MTATPIAPEDTAPMIQNARVQAKGKMPAGLAAYLAKKKGSKPASKAPANTTPPEGKMAAVKGGK
jgi:hypothetical protein